MPLAQRDMAVRKCVAVVHQARDGTMNNMKCPQCGGNLYCDGVGVQKCGPYICEECGWYEGVEADVARDQEADDDHD